MSAEMYLPTNVKSYVAMILNILAELKDGSR